MDVEEVKRRLKNAKRRARFWSGNPSWSKRVPSCKHCRMDVEIHYEMAVGDVNNLSECLKNLTRKPVKVYEQREKWRKTWTRGARMEDA